MNVHQIVEAVLFASDAPLTADEIARADEMLDEDRVQDALAQLAAEYDDGGRSFQVVELAEGYQILTRPEFDPYLERFDNVPRASRLSGPALETLAIIAYRQPIGRLEIEYVRGVGASGVIRTLQDRRLVDVVGRAEGLGRPLLYGTTKYFLEHFGFRSLEDLPRPEELSVVLRERIPLGEDEGLDPGGGEALEPGEPAAASGEEEVTGYGPDVEVGPADDDAASDGSAGVDLEYVAAAAEGDEAPPASDERPDPESPSGSQSAAEPDTEAEAGVTAGPEGDPRRG